MKNEKTISFNNNTYNIKEVKEFPISNININQLVTKKNKLVAMNTDGNIYAAMYVGRQNILKFYELNIPKEST